MTPLVHWVFLISSGSSRTNQPTTKLTARRHRPFQVTQVLSPVNYKLELPTQWSIHPVFHIDLLTPLSQDAMHGENFQHHHQILWMDEENTKSKEF